MHLGNDKIIHLKLQKVLYTTNLYLNILSTRHLRQEENNCAQTVSRTPFLKITYD